MQSMLQLEFADSEISRITVDPQNASLLRIDFAAALLRMTDSNDTNPNPLGCGNNRYGYSQGVSLLLTTTRISGDAAACTGRLSDGSITDVTDATHAGQRRTELAVPSQCNVPLRLDLQCANGAWLQIHATSLQCVQAADARWVEVFKC